MAAPLTGAWLVCAAQTQFLLDCLSPEQWEAPCREGKPIRAQFAHLNNVRLMLLKMSDKSLLGSMEQADRRKGSKAEIHAALFESGAAIATLIRNAESSDGRIKGLSRTAAAFLSGAAGHEGYHRGQIELILRQCGMELEEAMILRLWDYSKLSKYAQEVFGARSIADVGTQTRKAE